jgi:hypothetical protein
MMQRATVTELIKRRITLSLAFIGRALSSFTSTRPGTRQMDSERATGPARQFEQLLQATSGDELNVDIQTGGAVHVQGWEQNAVRVEARLNLTGWRETQVSLEPAPGGVHLLSRKLANSIFKAPFNHKFNIWVPRRYDVCLHSAGGQLTIADMEGTFRGSTAGGRITLRRARGRAELSTQQGEIQVIDSNLTGSIVTEKGPVRLWHVDGDLQASSRNK